MGRAAKDGEYGKALEETGSGFGSYIWHGPFTVCTDALAGILTSSTRPIYTLTMTNHQEGKEGFPRQRLMVNANPCSLDSTQHFPPGTGSL